MVAFAWLVAGCSLAWTQELTTTTPVPAPVSTRELHNVWQLSPRVISGSQPENDSAFAELAKLGVQTIVSVDGMPPQLTSAKQHNMRYVHIPIGYDGIDRNSALALTRVAREVAGKIYIHCHHGKHRGPAAAAILCRAEDGRSVKAAREILERAGTGREYAGLWRDVEQFEIPLPGSALPALRETVALQPLAAAMAKIDRSFDRLKNFSPQQWQALTDASPDAASESLQLSELFLEAVRTSSSETMHGQLQHTADLASKLHKLAGTNQEAAVFRLIDALQTNCKACHEAHRN